MGTQEPIVVGDVYNVGGTAIFKITVTYQGSPVTGAAPLVTVLRDEDKAAANFQTNEFEIPVDYTASKYSAMMTEVAYGTYFYEFNPTNYDINEEEIYTVIYHHESFPKFASNSEFMFTDSFGAKVTSFGLVKRNLNVCVNTPFKIAYQAISGIGTIRLTIYNPYNEIVLSDVPMQEMLNTGIYTYDTQLSLQGEHLIYAEETKYDTNDAMLITVGGDCDRLKRIETLIKKLTQNTPIAYACGHDPCA